MPLTLMLGLLLLGVGAARATQILAHQPLTLYGGPGNAFSVLTTIASGAKVEILWCNGEANWCLVQNGGVEGWAPRSALVPKSANPGGDSGRNNLPSGAAMANSTVNSIGGTTASIVGPSSAAPNGPLDSPPADGIQIGVSLGGAKAAASVH